MVFYSCCNIDFLKSHISHPLPNKTKLKFDQDFKAEFWLNQHLMLMESKLNTFGPLCICFWVCCFLIFFSVSLDYGMTALVAVISGQLQVKLYVKINLLTSATTCYITIGSDFVRAKANVSPGLPPHLPLLAGHGRRLLHTVHLPQQVQTLGMILIY